MFKKTIITTTALLVLATPAFAETVRDHYKTVIEQTPYSVEVCKDVQIRGQASTGDTVFGALLGGVIGNQFGGGKGKDAATILGAIVGADVANKNTSKTGGTQRQCQVETRYEETQREVYRHSTVTFYNDGKQYNVKFQK
jgi:uncharacterized protein YcfJ